MEFSARVTLAPYQTRVTPWMSWPATDPTFLTVGALVSAALGEFECAIEEREGETAYTRYSGRHLTTPGTHGARIEAPNARQTRLRCTSYSSGDIQLDIGLRGKAVP